MKFVYENIFWAIEISQMRPFRLSLNKDIVFELHEFSYKAWPKYIFWEYKIKILILNYNSLFLREFRFFFLLKFFLGLNKLSAMYLNLDFYVM